MRKLDAYIVCEYSEFKIYSVNGWWFLHIYKIDYAMTPLENLIEDFWSGFCDK